MSTIPCRVRFDSPLSLVERLQHLQQERKDAVKNAGEVHHAKVYAVELSVTPSTAGIAISAAFDPLRTNQDTAGKLVAAMVSHLRHWDR
ncbi:hypothetical protein H310_13907 [Aphanomyces invadans]|uniref:Uncharacterized protein n=1 Tax=Aphanomyces invadans TaxID=157072 RepID=A0A024TD49_9STRA|nr:hypothetical protein H310_13907 [Aphanomyces invadans]ETV91511.1 hypothetical protein H310_13907 [Aphanomyces invadans]|eukprot:XP_008879779.1 hypothetical protein H310_13907 [Aphanomyces invadans]